MKFNETITLFNVIPQRGRNPPEYRRRVISGVFWDSTFGAAFSKTGKNDSDSVTVMLPDDSACISAAEWAQLGYPDDRFALSAGDIIARGEWGDISGAAELERQYAEMIVVTSVRDCRFGSGGIDRLNKQLDDVKYRFMEVSLFDEVADEKFAAWAQSAKIDLKSWGGAAADGVTAPFDIVWEGERTYGTYDRAANTFTPTDGIESITVVSTAGTGATGTSLYVSPQLGTGNHYVYKGGASAQTVTAGQDLTSWTPLAVGTNITVTGSPATITVAEVDAANKAVKVGSVTAVYGG